MLVPIRLLIAGTSRALPRIPSRSMSQRLKSVYFSQPQARLLATLSSMSLQEQSELHSAIGRICPPSTITSIREEVAQNLLAKLLVQLRTMSELPSPAERQSYQASVDSEILATVKAAGHSGKDLVDFASSLLTVSSDPRRQPLAFRLFQIAHKAGNLDAGYYWASMVLQNTAPPPPSGDAKGRINDALTLYQDLSSAGNPLGSLGVARLLLQKIQKGQVDKSQSPGIIEQVIQLCTKAGDKGLAEAWYELSQLYQEDSRCAPPDADKFKTYLQKGADLGHSGCLYSLGTLYLLDNTSESKKLSFKLFHQAAEQGDAQSMFQVGSFYFLDREKMGKHSEVVKGDRTMKQVHKETFGLEPDDMNARYWFERSVEADYPPSMLQLALLLGQHRGLGPQGGEKVALKELDVVQADRVSYALLAKLLTILKTSGNLPSLPSQKGQWSNSQFNALIPQAQAMYEKLEHKFGEAETPQP